MARMLPREVSSWCRIEQVCQGEAKNVKRFERSNGLDTALYKNYLFTFFIVWPVEDILLCDGNYGVGAYGME